MFTKCESGNVLQTRTSPAAPSPPCCSSCYSHYLCFPPPLPLPVQCFAFYNRIWIQWHCNEMCSKRWRRRWWLWSLVLRFCSRLPVTTSAAPLSLTATPSLLPAHPSPPTLPLIFLLLLPFIPCLCQVQAKQLFLCFCVLLAEWRPNATRCVCVFEWECVCAMVCVCVSLWPCNLSW